MTTNEVIGNWIQAAVNRKLKIGTRFLTPDECDLVAQVLQALALDLSEVKP